MKEIKEKEIIKEPVKEIGTNQPSEKEMIDLLSQTVIQQDGKIKDLTKENEELKAHCNRLLEELEFFKKQEVDSECSECKCDESGYRIPWDKKRKRMYESLKGEMNYYEARIIYLKHELIELPNNKDIIKVELKEAEDSLYKIKRIMKEVVR